MIRECITACLIFPLTLLVVVGSMLKCHDGTYSLTCPPEPPPRCLVYAPTGVNKPPFCENVPGEATPEVDVDTMLSEFHKNRWDRNHY